MTPAAYYRELPSIATYYYYHVTQTFGHIGIVLNAECSEALDGAVRVFV